jgi:hypothetical protein
MAIAAIVVTGVLGVGAFLGARAITATDEAPVQPPAGSVKAAPIPAHADIEAKYGIQFTNVGITASGGLIDVRFRILDALKAEPVVGHHALVKMVIGDERAAKLLDTRAMTPGDSTLVAGQGYYVLFRNAGDTVLRGDWVDIFVGDLEIKHIRVV